MEFDRSLPIYKQIIEVMKQRMINLGLKPGDMAPSVRVLAMEMIVTTNTIQRVYMELVREELLIPYKGIGYQVTEEIEKINQLRKNFLSEKLRKIFQEMKQMKISKADLLKLIEPYLQELEDV
jgi:DNA-binding transcriptional regulator YhcF (GntR family)